LSFDPLSFILFAENPEPKSVPVSLRAKSLNLVALILHQPLTKIHNTFVVYQLLYKQEFTLILIEENPSIWMPVVMMNVKYQNFNKLEVS